MANTDRSICRLHPDDSVVVALKPLRQGHLLSEENTLVLDDIPAGHKVAVRLIPAGAAIIKYGQTIGFASTDIAARTARPHPQCDLAGLQP